MAKLWEKTYSLDALMEAFTVGSDPVLDARLVNADCVSSMAHARMLSSIGILSRAEADSLVKELAGIIELNERGKFFISRSDEDVHTAIENHLVRALGDTGKRIHTGRSRNDQVLTALRLWSRGFLFSFQKACLDLICAAARFRRSACARAHAGENAHAACHAFFRGPVGRGVCGRAPGRRGARPECFFPARLLSPRLGSQLRLTPPR